MARPIDIRHTTTLPIPLPTQASQPASSDCSTYASIQSCLDRAFIVFTQLSNELNTQLSSRNRIINNTFISPDPVASTSRSSNSTGQSNTINFTSNIDRLLTTLKMPTKADALLPDLPVPAPFLAPVPVPLQDITMPALKPQSIGQQRSRLKIPAQLSGASSLILTESDMSEGPSPITPLMAGLSTSRLSNNNNTGLRSWLEDEKTPAAAAAAQPPKKEMSIMPSLNEEEEEEGLESESGLMPSIIIEPNDSSSNAFMPSSPPMSPSPMQALATSERQCHLDPDLMDIGCGDDDDFEKISFSRLERSMTEIAVTRIRTNMTDDALQRRTQKSAAMLSFILQDQAGGHTHTGAQSQCAGDAQHPASPIETYLPIEEEDLSHMYSVYKVSTQSRDNNNNNATATGGGGGGSAAANPLGSSATGARLQRAPSSGNAPAKQTQAGGGGLANNNLPRLVTFAKPDPLALPTTQFQFVKERVPRRWPMLDDLDLTDLDDLDETSTSDPDTDTMFEVDAAVAAILDNPPPVPPTTTTPSTIVNKNIHNLSINTDLLKSPVASKQVSPRYSTNSPRMFTPVRSSQRRAQSMSGHYNSLPWVGAKQIQLCVFVPTQPQSMVELAVDEDATVDKVVTDVLELCHREKRKILSYSTEMLSPVSPAPVSFSSGGGSSGGNSRSGPHCNNNNNNVATTATPVMTPSAETVPQSPSLNNDNELSFGFLTVLNAKYYSLRQCNDYGEIDNDIATLDRTTEMRKIKCSTFALTQNLNYTNIDQSMPPTIFRVHIVASGPLTHIGEKKTPNSKPGGKDSIAVPYNPKASLTSIKSLVCRKEKVSEDLCVFMLMNNEIVNDESITLEELGVGDIKLIHNQVKSSIPKSASVVAESGNAPRAITKLLGPMFFFTPDTAGEFKQYHVVKVNKFGISTNRIMGIDQDRIIHSIVSEPSGNGGQSGNSSSLTPKKTLRRRTFSSSRLKTPIQPMKDIIQVGTNSNKPNSFYIKFKDGKMSEFYSHDSEEIVAKIQFIIKENRNKIKNEEY
ncbi:hypothetical protein SAMD00019534_073270 [Acytostelium subglobosum LB1]|uniref:hypothetical protein n=1 Tax=Acytostelium subglobosum LB1 TaxID=1410327 RepID=UPI0006451887|nr:hypothetical protein SAMD00019534_073270 [Acytostelium subglobosum LB1]GAM24152.1 hypothetical protein SAMD00019534_073270 [Acytostelium subglobosum LB1]|eukprot:XP_012753188.1 hypothetical protein SAMD00019534_073270 [Acytostelium subglobosum LB1]